jgi:hypothetical protein
MGERADWDFALRIRGVTPQRLPMTRLAEYLKQFAELHGSERDVHFAGIVKGSAVLRAAVEIEAHIEVSKRLLGVRTSAFDR